MDLAKVDNLLASLFPRCCILCGEASGDLNSCAACREDLPWIRRPCERCGGPLPPEFRGSRCAQCGVRMRRIERMRSALVYEYPIDRLIALAKFASRVECAHALGELLAAYLVSCRLDADVPDAITPVPLHRRRLAARGFNQALEIARPVAAGLGVPLLQDRCVRERNTPEQTSLAGRARFVNIAGAFRATGDFAGRHIAILDDVITTGSTAQSMATTLSRAGAARIQIWSVARAVRSAYSNV